MSRNMRKSVDKMKKTDPSKRGLSTETKETNKTLTLHNLNNIDIGINDNIIDDEDITPRAFDNTQKGKESNKSSPNKSRNSKNEKDTKKNISKRGASRGKKSIDKNKDINIDHNKDKQRNGKINGVNVNTNDVSMNNENVSSDNKSPNNNSYTNGENKNIMEGGQCPFFLNNMYETPKKSNIGNNMYDGIVDDNISVSIKYKTPSEMDMLKPDTSLIGNKCLTINNYISPPKCYTPLSITDTPKYPLSGDTDPNLSYDEFKGLFKTNACLLSENQYNANNVTTEDMHTSPKKQLSIFNSIYESNSRQRKEDLASIMKRMNTQNINSSNSSSYTTDSYGSSYTMSSSNMEDFGTSPRSRRKKSNSGSPVSTKKILAFLKNDASPTKKIRKAKTMITTHYSGFSTHYLNNVHSDINDNILESGEERNGLDKKNNQNYTIKLIDYEINPKYDNEESDGKTQLSMQELAKEKKNPLVVNYEEYSKELDVLFNKEIIETPILLLSIYQYLLVIIARRNQKSQPVFFELIKQEIINLNPYRVFNEQLLRQLAWLCPDLIQLHKVTITKEIYESNQTIYTNFVTGKKVEDIQIGENDGKLKDIYRYTSSEKIEMVKRIIINWANIKHNEFLKTIDKKFYSAKYNELKKWHSKFDFKNIIFPLVTVDYKIINPDLCKTPVESNADDFDVFEDSPIKCVTLDLKKDWSFLKDLDKEKTRTPLGRNRRKSELLIDKNYNNAFNKHLGGSPKKKETDAMRAIKEEANKKSILKNIKIEFDKQNETLLSEIKKYKNAENIAEAIYHEFIVNKQSPVSDINRLTTKLFNTFKNTESYIPDERTILEILQMLPAYIKNINIKPSLTDNTKNVITVKPSKTINHFLKPLTDKKKEITQKNEQIMNNRETRLKQLWEKHNVNFELTDKIKNYFLSPGKTTLADL
ncbi:conserved protein, unknown function [Hepatocystis sp. ex Piliocolobus tephrosceles]|nr:conserved protein, unknown function [Hepatocystis sp. ex Piliocolobus tephrosceles]